MELKLLKLNVRVTSKRCPTLKMRINEAGRYHYRWNLRLHCIPQSNQDDIKEKVVDICSTVVGDNHTKIKDNIDWAATTINKRDRGQPTEKCEL